jgi:hypothetical protein
MGHTARHPSSPSASNGYAGAALSLTLDQATLRSLIAAVVAEVLAQMEKDGARLDGRLAWSEAEAAALLGLEPHVLRDERRRGEIAASLIVGNRVRYSRDDLVNYLAERRIENGDWPKREPYQRHVDPALDKRCRRRRPTTQGSADPQESH